MTLPSSKASLCLAILLSTAPFVVDGDVRAAEPDIPRRSNGNGSVQLEIVGTPLKHFAGVTCARFSPDGRRLLTASLDNGARLWDSATGKLLGDLSEHDDRVLYAEFSPDGKRFVTASADDTARVWSAETGDWITGPFQHDADVLRAHFSPDSRTIVTIADDKSVRLWNATNGESLGPALRHMNRVTQAAFRSDTNTFVTITDDGTVRTWSVPKGESVGLPLSSGIDKEAAELGPAGSMVLSLERNKHSRLVNIMERRVSAELTEATGTVFARFSPDGQRILTVQESGIERVWDTVRGTAISVIESGMRGVTAAGFSRDGQWLAVGHRNGEVRMRLVRGGATTSVGQHTNSIVWLEFSPDGKLLATASLDGTAILWRIVRSNAPAP